MSARFLLVIFDSAYALALASWIGSLLVFTFGVAPAVAAMPAAEVRNRLVRGVFPRFYTWGVVSGAIALSAYLGVPLSFDEYRGPVVAVQSAMILAVTLTMLYGANSLTPALGAAGGADLDETSRARRLHRRMAGLNATALVLAAILLVALVNRPAPRTAGIVEPTPEERARAQYERLRRAGSSRPQTPSPAPVGVRPEAR